MKDVHVNGTVVRAYMVRSLTAVHVVKAADNTMYTVHTEGTMYFLLHQSTYMTLCMYSGCHYGVNAVLNRTYMTIVHVAQCAAILSSNSNWTPSAARKEKPDTYTSDHKDRMAVVLYSNSVCYVHVHVRVDIMLVCSLHRTMYMHMVAEVLTLLSIPNFVDG